MQRSLEKDVILAMEMVYKFHALYISGQAEFMTILQKELVKIKEI